MTIIRTTPALLLLVMCILLAAGCAENKGSIVPTITPVHASTQIAPPTEKPSIYWIKIDPVGDKQVGDVFTINATTNLSADEDILAQVYLTDWHPGWRGELSGATGIVKVIQGNNGINSLSFVINSSGFNPGKYQITEMPVFDNETRSITGSIQFNITPENEAIQIPSVQASWIIINPIGFHHIPETFEINGSTSVGVNEKLYYTVNKMPVAVAIPCPTGPPSCPTMYIEGADNISFGDISIKKGGSAGQKWSFLLNTSGPEFAKNNYGAPFEVNVTSQNRTIYNSTTFY